MGGEDKGTNLSALIDLQERVAHALWKHEAERAAPPSVAEGRTIEAFRDADESERSRWLGLSNAARMCLLDDGRAL